MKQFGRPKKKNRKQKTRNDLKLNKTIIIGKATYFVDTKEKNDNKLVWYE